ncbi:MAG: LON peptidase substrate-binding domain-containing protein [Thermomicrobiales bacterium]
MTDLLPLFPLGAVLFPGMPIPLHVFEERYRRMLADRHQRDPAFGIVLLRAGQDTEPTLVENLHTIGTATRIVSHHKRKDGRSDIVVTGTRRFAIQSVNWELGYGLATVDWKDDPPADGAMLAQSMQRTVRAFSAYVERVTAVTGRAFEDVRMSSDPIVASWELAARLPLHTWERQRILEMETAGERLTALAHIVHREQRLLAVSGVLGITLDYPGQSFTLN